MPSKFIYIEYEYSFMAIIDPVCGMKVDKKIESEYNGKKYYFCGEHCREEFNKNPLKYIR